MKKALCVLLFVLIGYMSNLSAQKLDLKQTTIDYGTIAQHVDGVRYFKFTNTGDKPLIISHAQQSCGCTVPSYPKHPIQPGEEASIQVKYATNRIGKFNKYVTLTTNDKEQATQRLTIKGEVLAEVEAAPKREATFLSK
ncbi:MAG: DUF1573 domain-containing protein [Aureispira sp.]|nr:DUF1573 domain-containing protein [Aureispira sp.]